VVKCAQTDAPIFVIPCISSAIFFTKQNNHRVLTVLFYIFDIPYHDGTALPLVAARSQKLVKMYMFGPKFYGSADVGPCQ